MSVDVKLVRHVCLHVGNLPRETSEDHAHEDDGHGPDVGQSRVVVLLLQDFRRKIRVGTDDPRGGDLVLARVVKHGGGTKVDELDDTVRCHDTIVELQISMSQTHLVEIVDTVNDLSEDTVDLRSSHLAGHDNREQVVRCVLHNLQESATTT